MSLNHRLRIVAPFALAAVALGMTACAPGGPDSTPTVTVSAPLEESSPVETTPEASEPMVEASEPMESEAPSEAPSTMGPNDESGVVDVTVAGDQGILALQHAGTVPTGSAGPTNMKLITGPGGCFALTNEGKPQLLVFPADATFVLQEGKPSATISGTEHYVGRQFDVATVAVPKTSVAGIPDRCLQGSDDTVLVVG
ncbi:MAG: hypothetical protein Q4P15_13555 [Propionibacteriaceae bacterium]|nr:hypothetical protein [Propionibacteriaceae bacterium]